MPGVLLQKWTIVPSLVMIMITCSLFLVSTPSLKPVFNSQGIGHEFNNNEVGVFDVQGKKIASQPDRTWIWFVLLFSLILIVATIKDSKAAMRLASLEIIASILIMAIKCKNLEAGSLFLYTFMNMVCGHLFFAWYISPQMKFRNGRMNQMLLSNLSTDEKMRFIHRIKVIIDVSLVIMCWMSFWYMRPITDNDIAWNLTCIVLIKEAIWTLIIDAEKWLWPAIVSFQMALIYLTMQSIWTPCLNLLGGVALIFLFSYWDLREWYHIGYPSAAMTDDHSHRIIFNRNSRNPIRMIARHQ